MPRQEVVRRGDTAIRVAGGENDMELLWLWPE